MAQAMRILGRGFPLGGRAAEGEKLSEDTYQVGVSDFSSLGSRSVRVLPSSLLVRTRLTQFFLTQQIYSE